MCGIETLLLGGLSAAGSIHAGRSQRGDAERTTAQHRDNASLALHNAEMVRMQARMAEGGADIAVLRGNLDEFMHRRSVGQVLAAQTMHAIGSGADPAYGTPLMQAGYSAAQGEADAQIIRARMMADRADALSGAANVMGGAVEQAHRAVGEIRAGSAAQVRGRNAEIGGWLGAGTNLLTATSRWPMFGGTSAPGAGGQPRLLAGGNPFGA